MLLGRLTSNAKAVQKQEGEDLSVAAISVFSLKLLVYLAVLVFTNWSLSYAIGAQFVVLSPIYRLTLGTLDCIFDREGYYCQVSIHILGTHLLHLSCTEIVCLSIIQRGTHAANVLWFLSNRPILCERNVPFSKYLLHKREKIKSFG